VVRLTPPRALFTFNDPSPPIIARFLPGQRFDLQGAILADAGKTITNVKFYVDGMDNTAGFFLMMQAALAGDNGKGDDDR